eukprot:1425582-Amphidinium_carterae.1
MEANDETNTTMAAKQCKRQQGLSIGQRPQQPHVQQPQPPFYQQPNNGGRNCSSATTTVHGTSLS